MVSDPFPISFPQDTRRGGIVVGYFSPRVVGLFLFRLGDFTVQDCPLDTGYIFY